MVYSSVRHLQHTWGYIGLSPYEISYLSFSFDASIFQFLPPVAVLIRHIDEAFHKAKQIESYIESQHTFCRLPDESLTTRILLKDNASVVTTQNDVVNRTFIFYT